MGTSTGRCFDCQKANQKINQVNIRCVVSNYLSNREKMTTSTWSSLPVICEANVILQSGKPAGQGIKCPYQNRTIPAAEILGLPVFQISVEGLNTTKSEVIQQLADIHQVAIVLLQEAHKAVADHLKLPGFILAASILSKKNGLMTFVKEQISWTTISLSPPGSNIEWLAIKIQETMVINVYKPPRSTLSVTYLPPFAAPTIYSGDFNCQYTGWGYNYTT